MINIKALHWYRHFPRFLAEVARVLYPGRHFLYADLRPRRRIAEWENARADAPMRLISERVIDGEVRRGLMKNSQRSLDLISRRVPLFLLGVARYYIYIGVLDSLFCR